MQGGGIYLFCKNRWKVKCGMKTFAVAVLVGMLGLSLGAVDLFDGAELTIDAGETCTVSGTHTIPRFVNDPLGRNNPAIHPARELQRAH